MTNATINEDDLIKKRLLFEGDSGNEDRLVNKLIKTFVKFSHSSSLNPQTIKINSEATNESEENQENVYEQIIASLSHAEFGLLRNQFILDMNKLEQDKYEVLYKKINSEIERATKKIVESKKDLQEARKIRKNRQEYDILARQILNYSNRSEMQAKIKALEDKVELLKKQENEYDRKIDLRRKQFSVVLQSLSTMKNLIENDLKIDDYSLINDAESIMANVDEINENVTSNQIHQSLVLNEDTREKIVNNNDINKKSDNQEEMEEESLPKSTSNEIEMEEY
jgi:THO complex subunit 7